MRTDLAQIMQWVPERAHVLDLGCGDGTLLAALTEHKGVQGYGLEIAPDNIATCLAKGVNVLEQDLDEGLSNIVDDAFDMVVMTQALQVLRRPDLMLDEMLRVARECIITFPNFAYWRHRLHLGMRGRMPVSKSLPHEWYDTPNIHLSTFKDFSHLCDRQGHRIIDRAVGDGDHQLHWSAQRWPNLFGQVAIFRIER
ncbi:MULTISPECIES: methionine biosynthesis protein MetW [Larsenimonas]|uniref:Methionine biosynthesis protein MetW n=1 Tax=Larsenimonas suaedae TaxID=1851019 RepID=A0ABU1GY95_9GAMM|nr:MULTISPECIES: methionine biosynthesis protein MetW [Larsenimonas]MCM2973608.1 methionine biosynthesis protein MetW [Larsenimonas suaedae]MCM5705319.1 methionine biosynthesis protein MetW [Larsenimonas salina]MDR5897022.1 methionine biosynthesis protein MetW [Larsenimonas suaedae]